MDVDYLMTGSSALLHRCLANFQLGFYCLFHLFSLFACWFQPAQTSQPTVFFSHNKPAPTSLNQHRNQPANRPINWMCLTQCYMHLCFLYLLVCSQLCQVFFCFFLFLGTKRVKRCNVDDFMSWWCLAYGFRVSFSLGYLLFSLVALLYVLNFYILS